MTPEHVAVPQYRWRFPRDQTPAKRHTTAFRLGYEMLGVKLMKVTAQDSFFVGPTGCQ